MKVFKLAPALQTVNRKSFGNFVLKKLIELLKHL